MVRKLLRDYGLSERANIMEKQKKKAQMGFANIIFASNNMRRTVLKGESPNTVALSPDTNELMLQMVMSQMAAMSEQLARLQAAQNVILQGRSPKRPREPGGGVTGAPRQEQSGAPGGTNINEDLEEGEEMEKGDDDKEVDFVSNNTASR